MSGLTNEKGLLTTPPLIGAAGDVLRGNEELFHILADVLPNLIWTTTADGLADWTNLGWAQYTGLRQEESLGHRWTSVLHPDDRPECMRLWREALESRCPFECQYRVRRASDGQFRLFVVRAMPVRDTAGKVVKWFGVSTDIEEQSRAAELELEIAERKRLEAQLVIRERLASVGTLAAGIAHEINNPLASVTLNLGFLKNELEKRSEDERAPHSSLLDAVVEAQEGCQRVRQIVRDVKTFSRTGDDYTAPVDVRRVIDASTNLAWTEIRQRARLVKDLDDLELVEANEGRLGQVILNLLVNAAHAIPPGATGKNEIRVRLARGTAGGIVISVSDTGSGIPPDVLPHIFDPFFTTKPPGEGTGLGLSICHNIVTRMGGHIQVETEVGRGTTFRLELPLPAAVGTRPAAHAPAHVQAPRGRLLLIDDEAALVASLARILRQHHEVEVVTDGQAALELIQRGRSFDLLICDVMMPGMSGIDLYAELERRAPEQAARTIFMSGGLFTPAARQFFDAHARFRLEKPVEPEHVVRTVSEALRVLSRLG